MHRGGRGDGPGGDIGDIAVSNRRTTIGGRRWQILPSVAQGRRDESEGGGKGLCVTAAMTGTGKAVSRGLPINWRVSAHPPFLIRTAAMDFTMPYSEPSGPQ